MTIDWMPLNTIDSCSMTIEYCIHLIRNTRWNREWSSIITIQLLNYCLEKRSNSSSSSMSSFFTTGHSSNSFLTWYFDIWSICFYCLIQTFLFSDITSCTAIWLSTITKETSTHSTSLIWNIWFKRIGHNKQLFLFFGSYTGKSTGCIEVSSIL